MGKNALRTHFFRRKPLGERRRCAHPEGSGLPGLLGHHVSQVARGAPTRRHLRERSITGDHIKQDLQCIQKNMYFVIFTSNSCSYLLWLPVIVAAVVPVAGADKEAASIAVVAAIAVVVAVRRRQR